MLTKDALTDVAEEQGWSTYFYNEDVEFSKFSPAGEDFSFAVKFDHVKDELRSYYEDFDYEEHVMMWMEARKNGVKGVPSLAVLFEDAKEIEKMLEDLVIAVHQADY